MRTPRIDTTELAEHIEKAARGVIGARADLAILDLVDRVGVEVRERLALHDDVRSGILRTALDVETSDDVDECEELRERLAWIYEKLGPIGPVRTLNAAVSEALDPPTEGDVKGY